METILCEVVTVERVIFSDQVREVLAPGALGELGILPKHAPLITSLAEGEMIIRKADGEEIVLAIHGGFMEVRENHVIVLADTAERAEDIDTERAEAARRRAETILTEAVSDEEFARARAALRRASLRLKVARSKRRWPPRDRPGMTTPEGE